VTSGQGAGPADRFTDDAFLGGALQILQPRSGYRAGLDAVMLAAAVPAPQSASVQALDVGAGVGTAGLCLARRVPHANVTLFEREPALAALAVENADRNDLSGRVAVAQGAVGLTADELRALSLAEESFDHILANPPYHATGAGTAAPDALKAGSHAMPPDALEDWARFMARMARPGGSVTVIHKADALPQLLAALGRRFGGLRLLPLHPRERAPAHRIIVQGTKGSRAPLTILPGFVLHGAGDAFTPAARAILHGGSALLLEP
jgi:tRNA1(Val) A37 N6-methylase TrmN6